MSFPRSISKGTYGEIVQLNEKEVIKKSISAINTFHSYSELDIHFRLNHKNLIKGIRVEDGNVVMPFLSSLEDHLKSNSTIESREKVVKQLANAVFYLHSKGWLHLDIKPQNCLYDDVSSTVYLCDYGLCYHVGNIKKGFVSKAKYGTDVYFPPENLEFTNVVNEKFDVWCLGMLMAYIMLGSKFSKDITILRKNLQTLNQSMEVIIGSMLESSPEKRSTMEEVVKMLKIKENHVDDLPDWITIPKNVEIKAVHYLISSFKGPYRRCYIRDMFFALDLLVRSYGKLNKKLFTNEEIVKACIKIVLQFYYPFTKLPNELNNLKNVEISIAEILKYRFRIANFYDTAKCTEYKGFLNNICKYKTSYEYDKIIYFCEELFGS